MARATVIGWDVGGANVKAALLGPDRSRARVIERPFPLWRDPHGLSAVLAETANCLGRADAMGITMTAELADCFSTKREGVAFVLEAARSAFPAMDLLVFGVDGRFRSVEAARRSPHRVAAANWMASATLVARWAPDALFLDVGSTTADVIPIAGGRVVARGRTDPSRLRTGELVYTGLLRTPVCAIARWLPLRGRRCAVAAEVFAIAGDAHLWLGRIGEADYTCETADGRGRSRDECGARLARMVCADTEMLRPADIDAIADRITEAQVQQIARAIRRVLKRLAPEPPGVAVLAGQGTPLARAAAERAGLATCAVADVLGPRVAHAAPAAAVAHLLAEAIDPKG